MTAEVVRQNYERDGFYSPVPILDSSEARAHREAFEKAEKSTGPLHYLNKVHTVFRSPFELASHPAMLDTVETLIGPDILLYNVTYIVKEPRTGGRVSWHQDLTYWGFCSDRAVSAWLALSPATLASGCMRMIPGSHRQGRIDHELTRDDTNLLFGGQTVLTVDEAQARPCPLAPGEASFHHGWTLHASGANESDERRIGVNIQYLAPNMRQTLHDADSAMLVRGRDTFGHFATDAPPERDLEPAAMRRRETMDRRMQSIYAAAMNSPPTV